MMGRLETGQERLFYHFRLEDQVPANHLLRKLDALLDLDMVRQQLEPFYSEIGRPSVDPYRQIQLLPGLAPAGVSRRAADEQGGLRGAAGRVLARGLHLRPPSGRPASGWSSFTTAEQHIKDGKNALRWTRLSCHAFRHNAVRLQLHALAYNLANFMRTLALPEEVEHWSLTTLREKLVKIGARIVRHGRYFVFQLAEVAVPRALFAEILRRIDQLRPMPLLT